MTVLITGGGGFLGRHLIAHVRRVAPDADVRAPSRAECDLVGDGLPEWLARAAPDLVIHAAGRLIGSEEELRRDNDRAAARLFEALGAAGRSPRVVLVGSAAVYGVGGSRQEPIEEETEPTPRGLYAETKRAAELHAARFAAAGGSVVIARVSNPVGPGMGDHLLCGTVARQIVAIERGAQDPALTLGDLSPLRDFIHVADVAAALWHLAGKAEAEGAYNVAAGRSTPVSEVVEMFLRAALVRPIEVRSADRGPLRSAMQEQWLGIRKLRATGWEPRFDLERAVSDLLGAERARASGPQ
jgi:GDP-4-dehydro-6-deoxy-D-mannose reductase